MEFSTAAGMAECPLDFHSSKVGCMGPWVTTAAKRGGNLNTAARP